MLLADPFSMWRQATCIPGHCVCEQIAPGLVRLDLLWQHSDAGGLDGIAGDVDLNWFDGRAVGSAGALNARSVAFC